MELISFDYDYIYILQVFFFQFFMVPIPEIPPSFG